VTRQTSPVRPDDENHVGELIVTDSMQWEAGKNADIEPLEERLRCLGRHVSQDSF
jgi:hypothetical protein